MLYRGRVMRSTLKNHMKRFGPDGLFTFNAGLTIEQTEEIGVNPVKRSVLHKFKAGDLVVIRGSHVRCLVKKVLGITLILEWPYPNWQSFYALNVPNRGRWNLGDVEIYKGHVDMADWTEND